jgi:hypothetical protein
MTPSILISEAWSSPDFKSFYISIFQNLFENTKEEKMLLSQQTAV